MRAIGKVKEINNEQAWFTLENGARFAFGKHVSLAGYKPGDEVLVDFRSLSGKRIASRVTKDTQAA